MPVVAVADVHVFDEAHDDAGAAETLHQIEHRVIVHAALHDGVDLDGREARAARVLDAVRARPRRRRSRRSCVANTSGSRLSRLTVMRLSPAAFSSAAYWASRMPLVVSATSSMPAMRGEIADEVGEVRRAAAARRP